MKVRRRNKLKKYRTRYRHRLKTIVKRKTKVKAPVRLTSTNLEEKEAQELFTIIQDYQQGRLKRKYYLQLLRQRGIGRIQSYGLLSAVKTGRLFVKKVGKGYYTVISFAAASPECHIQAGLYSTLDPTDALVSFEFQNEILEGLKEIIQNKKPRKRTYGAGRRVRTPERDSVYISAIVTSNYICDTFKVTSTRGKEYVNAWISGSHYVVQVEPPRGFFDDFIRKWLL